MMNSVVTLKTKRSEKHVEVRVGEPILFAGLRAGLDLPYECCSGTCGTCQASPVDAEAIEPLWPEAPGGGLLPDGEGRILMCQSAIRNTTELKLFGRLREITDETTTPDYTSASLSSQCPLNDDVIAFDLALDHPTRFKAGQFVLLQVPGLAGWRAYSMTSRCGDDGSIRLSFVIKKLDGGSFSDWLFTSNRVGERVRVFGPVGKACLQPESDGNIIAIAGGSGIAGIMSVIDDAITQGHLHQKQGQIFFGVRNRQAMFFEEELAELVVRANRNLAVTVAFSDEIPDSSDIRGMSLIFGNVHEVAKTALQDTLPSLETAVFVAGPTPMVEGAQTMLRECGLSDAQIRYDKFN